MNNLIGNKAGDKIVAGDENHHHYYADSSGLRKLAEQLDQEKLSDPEFKTFIEQLLDHITPIDPEDQRSLADKLTEADRQDEIKEASRLKERFAKTVLKNGLSEKAQHVYAQILAKIKTSFRYKVKPHLGIKDRAYIDNCVNDLVTEIHNELCGTNLNITTEDICGMLYFLTGNCHLEWK